MDGSLVYVIGHGTLPPFRILEAIKSRGYPVISVYRRPHDAVEREEWHELAHAYGAAIELAQDDSIAGVAARLLSQPVAGVVAHTDDTILDAAMLATVLGCPTTSVKSILLAQDKALMRAVLQRAGVPSARYAVIDSPMDVPQAGTQVGFPGVLKPSLGAGSLWVQAIHSMDELASHVEEMITARRRQGSPPRSHMARSNALLFEEFLAGTQWHDDPRYGDYGSVEIMAIAGEYHVLTVSDRLRLFPPFRETGLLFPSALPHHYQQQLSQVARNALAAIGFDHGFAHVELKFCANGPHIIEINPRLGGPIPRLWSFGSHPGITEAVVSLALGEVPTLAPFMGVSGELIFYADNGSTPARLDSMTGLERAAAIPGIIDVDRLLPDGATLDPKDGSSSSPFGLMGHRETHADLLNAFEQACQRIHVTSTQIDPT